jgi:Legionella pneumophila major outer membrane protein precursor
MFRSILALSCLSLTFLHAESKNNASSEDDFFMLFDNEYEKPKKDKEKKALKVKEISNDEDQDMALDAKQMNQRLSMTEPTSESSSSKMNHYLVYGDFLYWQPFCNDLTWGNLIQNPAQGSYTQQYRFGFSWDVGFRVGLQFKTNWQDITFDGNWTSYHNVSNSHKQNNNILNSAHTVSEMYQLQGDSDSVLGQLLSSPPFGWKIAAQYTMDFDQYDFTIKKDCKINDIFKIKPFVGVRGLILNHYFTTQSFANSYSGAFTTTPPFDYSEIKQKNNANAIGMLFGIDNNLSFGKGFSFFLMGDVFVGYGKNNSYFWNFQNVGGVPSAYDYIFEKSNSMKSMLDVSAGFSWKRGLFKNAIDLMFAAAYEFHYIFQNPTFLYGNPNAGDIQPTSFQDMSKTCGFQGLTIRGGIGF